MTLVLNGTTGVSAVDGSAATPAIQGNDSNTGIFFPAADTIAFAEGGVEVARFDSSGNFGIGTTSPLSTLDVVVGASGARRLLVNYDDTNITVKGASNTAAPETLRLVADNIRFNTGTTGSGTERARIDTSGNLLVGRTSYGAVSGISTTNAQSSNGWGVNNGSNAASFTTDRINFNAGAFYVLNTSSVGVALTNGATSWAAQSDERTKDIIEPISNAAEKVSSLRAVIGKYKTDEDSVRRSFLIAQDVQAVLPEAVSASDDEQGTLSLRYTDTIPLLVAAIQEQQALIAALQADVAALKGQA